MPDAMIMNTDAVISQNSDLVSAVLDEEVVLMSIRKGSYYGMDQVGSRIWELLEKPITFGRLLAEMEEAYEGDADQIRMDLVAFLEELKQEDLIVVGQSQAE